MDSFDPEDHRQFLEYFKAHVDPNDQLPGTKLGGRNFQAVGNINFSIFSESSRIQPNGRGNHRRSSQLGPELFAANVRNSQFS